MLYSGNYLSFVRDVDQLKKLMDRCNREVKRYEPEIGMFCLLPSFHLICFSSFHFANNFLNDFFYHFYCYALPFKLPNNNGNGPNIQMHAHSFYRFFEHAPILPVKIPSIQKHRIAWTIIWQHYSTRAFYCDWLNNTMKLADVFSLYLTSKSSFNSFSGLNQKLMNKYRT